MQNQTNDCFFPGNVSQTEVNKGNTGWVAGRDILQTKHTLTNNSKVQ